MRDFAELEAFPAWIAPDYAGEMHYLEARDEAGKLKRASLRSVAPWARSVIVCAINYNTAISLLNAMPRSRRRLDFPLCVVQRGLPRFRSEASSTSGISP